MHQLQLPRITHKGCTAFVPGGPDVSNCDALRHPAIVQTVQRPCDGCSGQQIKVATKTRPRVEQELGPEAQRMMADLREEALRAKAKLADEWEEEKRQGDGKASKAELRTEALRIRAEIAAEREEEKRQEDIKASRAELAKMQACQDHKYPGLDDQGDWDLVEDKAEIACGVDLDFEEDMVMVFGKRRQREEVKRFQSF